MECHWCAMRSYRIFIPITEQISKHYSTGFLHFVYDMGFPKLFSFSGFGVSLNYMGVKSGGRRGCMIPLPKQRSWDDDVISHSAKLGSSKKKCWCTWDFVRIAYGLYVQNSCHAHLVKRHIPIMNVCAGKTSKGWAGWYLYLQKICWHFAH